MKAVFVPTSVFGNTPGLQHEWAQTVRAAGADGIEIRRELFPRGSCRLPNAAKPTGTVGCAAYIPFRWSCGTKPEG